MFLQHSLASDQSLVHSDLNAFCIVDVTGTPNADTVALVSSYHPEILMSSHYTLKLIVNVGS